MKTRADVLLVQLGLCKSREKAQAQIIAGNVYAGEKQVKTSSEQYEEGIELSVRKDDCPFVSRGGLKLQKALDEFRLSPAGKVCLDIGASTGGFTDCLLQNGAAFVYAVDVGYGQFDWSLRTDARVQLHERTNARYLEPLERTPSFACADVSFISLSLILPAIRRCCTKDATAVVLVKPQFEAGREKVGKKGVVRDKGVHAEVIRQVMRAASDTGFFMEGLTYSPVKGPNGNIEFLAYLVGSAAGNRLSEGDILRVVDDAHKSLH